MAIFDLGESWWIKWYENALSTKLLSLKIYAVFANKILLVILILKIVIIVILIIVILKIVDKYDAMWL